MVDKLCIVFLCNAAYYSSFRHTYQALLTTGCYRGDVVLVVGDDLYDKNTGSLKMQDTFLTENSVRIKYFPDYKFDANFLEQQKNLGRDGYWFDKRFQYHKFHLFDTYFKAWDYIFYMDCGVHIYSDISPILNERCKNSLLANRDGLDFETAAWCIPETPGEGLKIGDQFVKTNPIYESFKTTYDTKAPYFQTTIMLYDTNIITESTVKDLHDLLFSYPICITNDQGFIALYFTQLQPCWQQLRRRNETTYFYDYVRCVDHNYIMVKSTGNQYIKNGYK